jgi:hypothetical protein
MSMVNSLNVANGSLMLEDMRAAGSSANSRVAYCPSISSTTGQASNHSLNDFYKFSSDLAFRTVCSEGTPMISRPVSIAKYYERFMKAFMTSDVFVTIYPYCCNSISHRSPVYLLDALFTRILTIMHPGGRSILYIVDLPIDQLSGLSESRDQAGLAHRVEGSILKSYDVLCVFNDKMKERIKDLYGIPDDRFVEFEMLDYGMDPETKTKDINLNGTWNIVHTGNTTEQYIGRWPLETVPTKGIMYDFYGRGGDWLNDLKRSDIVYHGVVQQTYLNDLTQNSHFGIIFYQRASGTDYIELGSTSKFSSYLAAGIPIIASKSHHYISSLISKYDIGLTFESIADIPEILGSLTTDRYLELRRNAGKLREKVVGGYFFKHAITESLDMLGQ